MKPSRTLTMEQLRERSCGQKIKYFSRAAARFARKRYQRTYGVRMSAYKCIFCGLYHIGHKYKQVEV